MRLIRRRKGEIVSHGGVDMRIVATPEFDTLTLQGPDGEYLNVSLADLQAEHSGKVKVCEVVDVVRQEKIPAYLKAFESLLDRTALKAADVEAAGSKVGIGRASAYAALARYRLSGSTADLPPPTRSGGRGKSRLSPDAEKTIKTCIEEVALTRRNFSRRKFLKEAALRLEKAGFKVSRTTLRNRLDAIPDHKWNKARRGYNETRRTHDPLKGSHPDVGEPLASLQIDHWKADIEILDDDRTTIIGRVWITLAIDVFSRMVWGLHVGLDDPSTTTVGLTMISGMTAKDGVKRRYGLTMDCPIAGKPKELKADNAGEFRGDSLQRSCEHFAIKLTWRPLGAPQYGGHIERLNGTLAQRFKDLPGATGATPKERKAMRPEKTAAFTLEDVTRHVWLLVDEYHNEVHSEIGSTPLEKYKGHFYGPRGQKRNLPAVYADEPNFRRQWYPLKWRSLQPYGIRIDHLSYYSDAIAHLVKNRKDYERIQIRRNPFDVREIFLLHPVRNEWIAVPTRHIGFPDAAIRELAGAKREALRRKREPTPETLARIIEEQRRHIEESQRKTKTAQRDATRRKHHERIRKEAGHAVDRAPASIVSGNAAASKPSQGKTRRRPIEAARSGASPSPTSFTEMVADKSDEDIARMFDD